MAYEKKNGTGAIFRNNKLKDTHPEYRGSIITPSGEELELSLWVKEAKSDGKKFFSVSVQEPYKKDNGGASMQTAQAPAPAHAEEVLDDLPF